MTAVVEAKKKKKKKPFFYAKDGTQQSKIKG